MTAKNPQPPPPGDKPPPPPRNHRHTINGLADDLAEMARRIDAALEILGNIERNTRPPRHLFGPF